MARKSPSKYPETPIVPSDWLSNADIKPTDPGLFWEDGQDGLELVNTFPTTTEGGPMEQQKPTTKTPAETDPDAPVEDYGHGYAEEPSTARRRNTPIPAIGREVMQPRYRGNVVRDSLSSDNDYRRQHTAARYDPY